jgi:multidrug resistance efflux pump
VALFGPGAVALALAARHDLIPNPFGGGRASADPPPAPAPRSAVAKVIAPRLASSVPVVVEQLATVEPYYRADLRARASGLVRRVNRDLGEKVKAGEVLVEIDVPESEQEVARAGAMVLQRQQELKVSEAKLKDAKALRDVSAATIKQRTADVDAATATSDFRKRKFERLKELAARGTVVGSVVEEEEREYLAAAAAVASANANVERARADFAESESKVEAASSDIELKRAQIEVARKELERAKAVEDYARVRAPFDGVVVKRTVDPGSFVQNATTGASEALISVSRVDLVTVTAKFPDTVAPFVTPDTLALVTVDDLPEVSVPVKVTRFAPSVQNADHTMRVEIDLFNGDEADYARLLAELKAAPGPRATKGPGGDAPARAFPSGSPLRLLPGMTANVTLTLGGYGQSYVLPSPAVYSRGGAAFLMLVEGGVTREVPVRVQLNDGKTVRVALLGKKRDADGKTRDVLTDLTGKEQVVVARQAEFGNAARVQVAPSDW